MREPWNSLGIEQTDDPHLIKRAFAMKLKEYHRNNETHRTEHLRAMRDLALRSTHTAHKKPDRTTFALSEKTSSHNPFQNEPLSQHNDLDETALRDNGSVSSKSTPNKNTQLQPSTRKRTPRKNVSKKHSTLPPDSTIPKNVDTTLTPHATLLDQLRHHLDASKNLSAEEYILSEQIAQNIFLDVYNAMCTKNIQTAILNFFNKKDRIAYDVLIHEMVRCIQIYGWDKGEGVWHKNTETALLIRPFIDYCISRVREYAPGKIVYQNSTGWPEFTRSDASIIFSSPRMVSLGAQEYYLSHAHKRFPYFPLVGLNFRNTIFLLAFSTPLTIAGFSFNRDYLSDGIFPTKAILCLIFFLLTLCYWFSIPWRLQMLRQRVLLADALRLETKKLRAYIIWPFGFVRPVLHFIQQYWWILWFIGMALRALT